MTQSSPMGSAGAGVEGLPERFFAVVEIGEECLSSSLDTVSLHVMLELPQPLRHH